MFNQQFVRGCSGPSAMLQSGFVSISLVIKLFGPLNVWVRGGVGIAIALSGLLTFASEKRIRGRHGEAAGIVVDSDGGVCRGGGDGLLRRALAGVFEPSDDGLYRQAILLL